MIDSLKSQRCRVKRCVQISLSVLMLLIAAPQHTRASSVNENVSLKTPPGLRILPSDFLNPTLPSLDNPSAYLPKAHKPVRLVLRLGERRVYVYHGNQTVASYPVAVGKPGWETPTGEFTVIQKIENPVWENPWTGEVRQPGANSALGMRWIGFWTDGTDTIGFHGTPTVNSIGQAASHGCVRMRNEHVVALFEQVEIGTVVVVEP